MEASTQPQPAERSDAEQRDDSNLGSVEEVQGVVVEVAFPPEHLPEIYNALEVEIDVQESEDEEVHEGNSRLVLEVQQHLGDDRVRTVAMDATDGLSRGTTVRDTGGPIAVPVGEGTLGRLFNLLGDPIDDAGEVKFDERWPIHRPAPSVEDLTPTREIFETGSRSSTCSRPTRRAARWGSSAERAWARPCSSRS